MFFDNAGEEKQEKLKVKVGRAYGECLGIRRRGRTQRAAKSHGELRVSVDPWESEWGNPPDEESGIMR